MKKYLPFIVLGSLIVFFKWNSKTSVSHYTVKPGDTLIKVMQNISGDAKGVWAVNIIAMNPNLKVWEGSNQVTITETKINLPLVEGQVITY